MDFTPLYHLRERLKVGAIAGTALIAEDFRLPRALEAIAPFESAAPVFAKIGQAVRTLLDSDCSNRTAALLNALSLLDAVLTAQSAVNVSEEIKPIEESGSGSVVLHIPYSVLASLIDALTHSGNGRYSFVLDTYQERPELFADYRVKHALVKALGAPYAELANMAEQWLSKDSVGIIPMLLQAFDPKGKKEMVRVIHVIEAVSGADSNDFYISALEQGSKEVRLAAIYALRHDERNSELLIKLAKTEKGTAKKYVYWAMSRMESSSIWNYWSDLAAKKADVFAEHMLYSTAEQASNLIAKELNRLLDDFAEGLHVADAIADTQYKGSEINFQALLSVLPGKSGAEICDFYRRAAALEKNLNKFLPPIKPSFIWSHLAYQQDFTFSRIMPRILAQSLLFNPTDDLTALAVALYHEYGILYAEPYLIAALITQNGEEFFASGMLVVKAIEDLPKKTERKEWRKILENTLGKIRWSEELQHQIISNSFYDPLSERWEEKLVQLAAPLDEKWYDMMISKQGQYDDLLFEIIQPNHEALCARLGKYFYERAKKIVNNESYVSALREVGWGECAGLAQQHFANNQRLSTGGVINYLDRLPGSDFDKAAEAEQLIKLAEEGKIALVLGKGIEGLREYVMNLRNTGSNTL